MAQQQQGQAAAAKEFLFKVLVVGGMPASTKFFFSFHHFSKC
jgi:hypothetical protein